MDTSIESDIDHKRTLAGIVQAGPVVPDQNRECQRAVQHVVVRTADPTNLDSTPV